jgi:hypothetical protein
MFTAMRRIFRVPAIALGVVLFGQTVWAQSQTQEPL